MAKIKHDPDKQPELLPAIQTEKRLSQEKIATREKYIELLQKLEFDLFTLEKNNILLPFDINNILKKYTGRKYTNIIGFKGKYLRHINC